MKRRNFLAIGLLASSACFSSSKPTRNEQSKEIPMTETPKPAKVLFDGKDLSQWLARKGGDANWTIKDGYMEVVPGTGDIYTKEVFTDFQLHVEFWLPLMADQTGQARANSGVYLQGRYEIQVLDSFGLESQDNDCGAIYKVAAPLVNACRKPEEWQSYDVAFRAARFDGDILKEKARVTVFHNDVLIHNNLEMPAPTGGALDEDMRKPGPLLLQDHRNPVRYRNVWIMPVGV